MDRRVLTASVLLLAGGAVHTRLAIDAYGTDDLVVAFFVNGIASALVVGALAFSRSVWALVAGIGVAAGSLVALALSRTGDGLLGFQGNGLDPAPDALLTIVFEGVALVLLAWVLLERRRDRTAVVGNAG